MNESSLLGLLALAEVAEPKLSIARESARIASPIREAAFHASVAILRLKVEILRWTKDHPEDIQEEIRGEIRELVE